jgi:hypothetical protein
MCRKNSREMPEGETVVAVKGPLELLVPKALVHLSLTVASVETYHWCQVETRVVQLVGLSLLQTTYKGAATAHLQRRALVQECARWPALLAQFICRSFSLHFVKLTAHLLRTTF